MSYFNFGLIFSFILISLNTNAQNLALNKSYILSTPPNYINAAPSSDKTSLTDGIYTKGYYFWSQRTTVGWVHETVTITIDLGEIEPINSLTFNTVRFDKQFVNFPKNIYVFISNDGEKFKYAGDAADTSDNLPGDYLVKKFSLNNIHTSSRYVRLSVIPNGTVLYCDEIEVLKGQATALQDEKLIPREQLKQVIDSLKNLEFLRQNLIGNLTGLQQISKEKTGVANSKYLNIQKNLAIKNISENDLENLKTQAGAQHALEMANISKSPYTVEMYNPWDSLAEFYEPRSSGKLKYNYYVSTGGVRYGCFIITSGSVSPQTFTFKVANLNSSHAKVELFDVPYVPSLNYTKIPDPIVSIKGNIIIGPGRTEMFVFRITGLKAGVSRSTVLIRSQNKETVFSIDISTINLFPSQFSGINAIVWSYFFYPMIKDRTDEAFKDLVEHDVNTIPIPDKVLPMMQTNDYSVFLSYISTFKGVKNILLFMNYGSATLRNGYQNGQFLSPDWKKRFKEWYNKITNYLKDNGFANAQIFLYPYDEVNGKDITDFKNLVSWAKTEIPEIKFYATLANDAAIDTILPLIDVAQIQSTYKGLTKLPAHKADIWTYSGSAPSRALSPYKFYRLMSWEAFANDYKGIGFWNYADEGRDKQLNLISDPLTFPTNSYSVIYDGAGKEIISSRRWEAFRLGIEDYSVLKLYANKFGIGKAKELANNVLSDPTDINKADDIINKMIVEITKR